MGSLQNRLSRPIQDAFPLPTAIYVSGALFIVLGISMANHAAGASLHPGRFVQGSELRVSKAIMSRSIESLSDEPCRKLVHGKWRLGNEKTSGGQSYRETGFVLLI